MRLTQLIISITLMIFCGTASAAELTYRVAGVVGQEERWLFAVIEDSGGGCSIYSKGDTLGNWFIVDVTPQGVVVDAAGERRILKLEGSAFIARKDETDNNGPDRKAPLIASTRPVQGDLTQQELRLAVNNIADDLGRNKQKELEPQVLNAILGFAPQTVITALNERPINSTREVVAILQTALNGNLPVAFTVSEGTESTKIYFRPNEPTTPHPHP